MEYYTPKVSSCTFGTTPSNPPLYFPIPGQLSMCFCHYRLVRISRILCKWILVWFLLFLIIIFRSIYVVLCTTINIFLLGSSISLYRYIKIYLFTFHGRLDYFSFWQIWIEVRSKFMNKSLCEQMLLFLLGKHPEVELLDGVSAVHFTFKNCLFYSVFTIFLFHNIWESSFLTNIQYDQAFKILVILQVHTIISFLLNLYFLNY